MMDENSFGDVSFEPFQSITPSSISKSWANPKPSLNQEKYLMLGVVKEVIPPSSSKSRTKTQYEYIVAAVGELNTHKQVHCLLKDHFGGINDFETFTLKTGFRCAVECVQGNPDSGVILGGISNRSVKVDEALGHHWMARFNKITRSITSKDEFYVKHDNGNEMRVEPGQIILQDSTGIKIQVDKTGKKIVITDGSGESITIDKNAKKITVEAKDLNLELKGNLKANVKGNVDVKAKTINLNGSSGKVVTTLTHPVDFVTGIPIKGVGKVKAG